MGDTGDAHVAVGVLAGYATACIDVVGDGKAPDTLWKVLTGYARLKAAAVSTVEREIPAARRSPLGSSTAIHLGHVDDVLNALRVNLCIDR